MGGLCQKHYDEDRARKLRRDVAIRALHTSAIDGRVPDDLALRDELYRLVEWWNRACTAVNTRRGSTQMPMDEADDALEWCIALAQEIVDAELAVRAGDKVSDSVASTGAWVWERFRNLEAGLRSNGTTRR